MIGNEVREMGNDLQQRFQTIIGFMVTLKPQGQHGALQHWSVYHLFLKQTGVNNAFVGDCIQWLMFCASEYLQQVVLTQNETKEPMFIVMREHVT